MVNQARVVRKYSLVCTPAQAIIMPLDARLIDAEIRGGFADLWVEQSADPNVPMGSRLICLVGTDHVFETDGTAEPLTTLVAGQYVWHVYDAGYLDSHPEQDQGKGTRLYTVCTACNGSRVSPIADGQACGTCRGQGRIAVSEQADTVTDGKKVLPMKQGDTAAGGNGADVAGSVQDEAEFGHIEGEQGEAARQDREDEGEQ